jgi:hypothetical protein
MQAGSKLLLHLLHARHPWRAQIAPAFAACPPSLAGNTKKPASKAGFLSR